MNSTPFFGSEVVGLLTQAGWYPKRVAETISLPNDVNYPINVQAILREYGGLIVRSEGPGVDLGRNSIVFDPLKAEGESGEDGTLGYFSKLIGTTLYPIGYIPDEALFVCLDSAEKVYMAGDYLYWVGNSFVEGVDKILLGIESKQLDEDTLDWG